MGCSIDWPTTLADTPSTTQHTISASSSPSSYNVVVSESAALPMPGTAWNVTVVATPLSSIDVSTLIVGGAYFGRESGRDVLLIQQSNAFDETYIYLFCSVQLPTRSWSIATQLLAHDDAARAGSIALEVWSDEAAAFAPIANPSVVLNTTQGSTNQVSMLSVLRTVELDQPTTAVSMRFVVTSSGGGSRDVFGVYPVRIQGIYDVMIATSITTTSTSASSAGPTTNSFVGSESSSFSLISSSQSTSFSSSSSSSSTNNFISTSTSSNVTLFVGASDAVRSGEFDAALIGGIVGGAVFLICIAVLAAVCWHRKRSAAPVADVKQGHLLPISEVRSESVEQMYDRVPRLSEHHQLQTEYDAPTSALV